MARSLHGLHRTGTRTPARHRRARHALAAAGYTRLDQLADVPEKELQALHGVGPRALGVLREALVEHGLRLS